MGKRGDLAQAGKKSDFVSEISTMRWSSWVPCLKRWWFLSMGLWKTREWKLAAWGKRTLHSIISEHRASLEAAPEFLHRKYIKYHYLAGFTAKGSKNPTLPQKDHSHSTSSKKRWPIPRLTKGGDKQPKAQRPTFGHVGPNKSSSTDLFINIITYLLCQGICMHYIMQSI